MPHIRGGVWIPWQRACKDGQSFRILIVVDQLTRDCVPFRASPGCIAAMWPRLWTWQFESEVVVTVRPPSGYLWRSGLDQSWINLAREMKCREIKSRAEKKLSDASEMVGGSLYWASVQNHGDSQINTASRMSNRSMVGESQDGEPEDILLASLCQSLGHSIRVHLDREHMNSEEFAIYAQAGLTPDKRLVDRIEVTIEFENARHDDSIRRRVLSGIGNSKMYRILRVVPGAHVVIANRAKQSNLPERSIS